MTEQDLVKYGWRKNAHASEPWVWRDPKFLLAHHSFKNAVEIQQRRLRGEPVGKPGVLCKLNKVFKGDCYETVL